MKTHSKLTAVVLATKLLLLSSVASTAAMPSDKSVLKIFALHKIDFERLRTMVTADSANESFFSERELNSTMPEVRRQDYRSLIRAIDPKLSITVDYDQSVRFILAGKGSAVGPDEFKGVSYTPTGGQRKGRALPNLDNATRLEDGLYAREIDTNWSIIYQRAD